MKKILAATTALVLAGGAAFAEVTVGGDGRFGAEYTSAPAAGASSTTIHQRVRLKFSATGTTDGGLEFGGGTNIVSGGGAVDEGTVHVSGAFGKLSFGDNDTADTLAGGIADPGIKGIGVDDVAESGFRDSTADDIRYDHALGTLKLAVSAGPVGGSNEYAVGASFSSAGITVGVGWDSNETTSLGLNYVIDTITLNAYMARQSGSDGMGADVTYALGSTSVTAVFAQNSDGDNAGGVGLSHDLGGGAKVVGGFGQVPGDGDDDRVSKAELGMTFEF